MSGVSSESGSEAGSIRKKYLDEEEWGDDVSILSRYEGPSPAVVITKVVMALVLIGACCGALVYSIIHAETRETVPTYNPPEDFPIETNQTCAAGTLYITYRSGGDDGGAITYTYQNISISWYQDDAKKRIYHKVGLENKYWMYTYYVFDNVTFYVDKTGCNRTNTGYVQFLGNLGLSYIQRSKTEEIIIGKSYTEVEVYEGEPPSSVAVSGAHPSLIRGYASTVEKMTYGWEQYFAHTDVDNSVYKQEYFFPTMQHAEPDFSLFDLPDVCLDQ